MRNLLFRDRKRERRLAALLKEYQASTAAMPDAAMVLNDAGEMLWFNDAAHRMLGLSVPRDIGQRVDNLIRNPRFVSYLGEGDYASRWSSYRRTTASCASLCTSCPMAVGSAC